MAITNHVTHGFKMKSFILFYFFHPHLTVSFPKKKGPFIPALFTVVKQHLGVFNPLVQFVWAGLNAVQD